jgi:alginate O-acetyltransferase complex protein AlgI
LTQPRTLKREQFEEGCWLILYGFFLKMVVADNLSPLSQRIFGNPAGEQGAAILFGVYAAAWQIFGDFAGYSNIARGLSKLMGIELMENFRQPYFAVTPADFWRRWHISLSTWLRDYLYIPLGGNRGTSQKTYRNLMLTMVIGGLWHGAAWNFVAWGFFHGLILCLWRLLGDSAGASAALPLLSVRRLMMTILFFHVTCFGWMLFFAKNLRDVPILIENCLFKWQLNGLVAFASLCVFVLPVLCIEFVHEMKTTGRPLSWWTFPCRLTVYALMLTALLLSGNIDSNDFIYFQF